MDPGSHGGPGREGLGHLQGIVGAGLNAHLAARAVLGGHLDAEVHALEVPLGLARDEALRGGLRLLVGQHEGPDGGVRAHVGAVVALRAVARDPPGDERRNGALRIRRGGRGRAPWTTAWRELPNDFLLFSLNTQTLYSPQRGSL
jgi:hypothetical protein